MGSAAWYVSVLCSRLSVLGRRLAVLGRRLSSCGTCFGRYDSIGTSSPLAAKNMAAAERGTKIGSSAATRAGEREGGTDEARVVAVA